MEQCFRIALWMVVLIGYLHAGPICFQPKDFKFDDLRNISCNDNVRFSSPTNVTGNCYTAGLKEFMKGMELAMKECKDDDGRIDQAFSVMERYTSNPSETCHFNMIVHEQFASFVNNTKTFIQDFNSHSRCK